MELTDRAEVSILFVDSVCMELTDRAEVSILFVDSVCMDLADRAAVSLYRSSQSFSLGFVLWALGTPLASLCGEVLFDSWKVLQVHGSFITRGMIILLVFRSSALSFDQRLCDKFCCYCCFVVCLLFVCVCGGGRRNSFFF